MSLPAAQKSIVELLGNIEGLISPPIVCIKINDLLRSGTAGAKEFADVISTDPNLTVRLLRVANSPYYSFQRTIDSIQRAVAIIGTTELYQLVLSVTAVNTFNKLANDVVEMDIFWRHSIYVGLVARALAVRAKVSRPERCFVAGLVHDIGSLVLYHRYPKEMKVILIDAEGDEQNMFANEQELFSFNHASVAGHMMQMWNFPEPLVEAIACHHQPDAAQSALKEAHILNISDALVNETEIGNFMGAAKDAEISLDQSTAALALDVEDLEFAVSDASELLDETLAAMFQ